MTRRDGTKAKQASFLDVLLLESETDPPPIQLPTITATMSKAPQQPSDLSPTAKEMADLFGFISALEKTSPDKITSKAKHTEQADALTNVEANEEIENQAKENDESRSSLGRITPQWLVENHHDSLARIASIHNSMREFEALALQENTEQFLASQLSHHLHVTHPTTDVERELSECYRALELLTRRLYGGVTNESRVKVNRHTETLMENALRQPYKDEVQWIRQAIEAAVRKCLADPSKQIYTAFIVLTLLRPFRAVVRELLQANELPFSERVLAQVRETDCAKMMRESLQALARLGLTAQTTTLAWQAARSGQSENALTPWIARRIDGSIAAIWEGYATVEHRVVRTLGYALLATFDADKHITHQTTIAEDDIERAKQILLAQGYRCGESAYPQDNRVVKLWCEFCRGRDSGWWFGDEAGRVMVVIPYLMRRRLSYHKPLCRAVSQMQAWGYRFYYDDHTLYFLPSGVELPADAFRNGDVAEQEGGE